MLKKNRIQFVQIYYYFWDDKKKNNYKFVFFFVQFAFCFLFAQENSLSKDKPKGNFFNSIINYEAEDSLVFLPAAKIMSLYGKAKVDYEKTKMEAYLIINDMEKNELSAEPFQDSLGGMSQSPVFKEADGQIINASRIRYNFKTERGLIYNIKLEENKAFIYGEITKKQADGQYHIRRGTYTTCDEEHPHFGFCFARMMSLPDDKMVTGFGYLQIADVPLFPLPQLVIPSNTKKKAGVIIPTFNQSNEFGLSFTDGGWYQPIGEYVNLKFLGDIYSRGTWNARQLGEYKVRYAVNGNWLIDYRSTPQGDIYFDPDQFGTKRDFKFQWQHRQDPTFHPSLTFSADVTIGTSSFDRYDPLGDADQKLNNTYNSGISFRYHPLGKDLLSVRFSHEQKTIDSSFTITFPDLNINLPRAEPLKWIQKARTKKNKDLPPLKTDAWYSKWTLNLGSFRAGATWRTKERFIFGNPTSAERKEDLRQNLSYGASLGTLSTSLPLKIWKSRFTLTPSLSTSVNFHFYSDEISTIRQDDGTYSLNDTIRRYNPMATASFRPSIALDWKVTGLWLFKNQNSKIEGFRHVITPTTSISYQPRIDYQKYYYRQNGNQITYTAYDPYQKNLYRGLSQNLSASLGFGLNQQLEMKWRTQDPKTGKQTSKIVKLIDRFSINSSYDFLKDSNQLSDFTFNVGTKIYDLLEVTYNSTYTPYLYKEGSITKHFLWGTRGRLLEMRSTQLNFNLPLNNDKFLTNRKEKKKENPYAINISFNVGYSINFNKSYNKDKEKDTITTRQTLDLNSNINLTKNWKISVRTGYDFTNRGISYTNINVTRDLHCWEASFSWQPIQERPSYIFSIRVKAAQLADFLKHRINRPFFGNYLN